MRHTQWFTSVANADCLFGGTKTSYLYHCVALARWDGPPREADLRVYGEKFRTLLLASIAFDRRSSGDLLRGVLGTLSRSQETLPPKFMARDFPQEQVLWPSARILYFDWIFAFETFYWLKLINDQYYFNYFSTFSKEIPGGTRRNNNAKKIQQKSFLKDDNWP